MAAPVPPKETQDPGLKTSAGDFGAPEGRPAPGVFALRVQAAWDETPTLRGLRLSGPAALIQQYHTPGQYLELMHAAAGSAYFALAEAPAVEAMAAAAGTGNGTGNGAGTGTGTGMLELLVRRGPGLAGVLAALQPEDTTATRDVGLTQGEPRELRHPEALVLRTHGVRGTGFPLHKLAGRDLLLVAAGSGIAPLRAVLQGLQRQRQRFGRVALYYGERLPTDFAYRAELLALSAVGVTLELALTRPPADWRGGVGYVQTHLRALPPSWLGPNTAALLCGQPEMISEATALLTQHHVPPSQILLNY